MKSFNEYIDLIKKLDLDRLGENKEKLYYLLDKLSILNNKKIESKVSVLSSAIAIDDFIDAYADMKNPDIFEKILNILNKKLEADGYEPLQTNFKPSEINKYLDLANRYIERAKIAKYNRSWSLYAFYLRSLAYFIPLLIDAANNKENKLFEEVIVESNVSLSGYTEDKWKKLDEKTKAEYIKEHPMSRYAKDDKLPRIAKNIKERKSLLKFESAVNVDIKKF